MGNLKKPSFRAKGLRSSLSGPQRKHRKVALLVGAEYVGNGHYDRLYATHKDVLKMKGLLTNIYRYTESDITVLIDDDDSSNAPTRENIIQAMNKLVSGSKAGDQLFFHFSGHGDQTPCAADDKSEDDGMDEAIIPCDATEDKDTWIIDNEMNEILVKRLPVGAQLIAIFDMCHSGTALDLKHYKCYKEELEGISRNGSASQAGPSAPRTDAQASPKHGVKIPIRQGSVHVCKRTSHQEVEKEKVVLRELPESAMDGQAKKGNRRYSLKTRKSTMRSELSPISETSPKVRSGSSGSQTGDAAAVSLGVRKCSKCGGSQSEREAGERTRPPGFVPPRSFTQTSLPHASTGDSISRVLEGASSKRRLSDPSPYTHSAGCNFFGGCLCFPLLQRKWLPGSPRRSLTTGVCDVRTAKKVAGTPPESRSSSTSQSSITPLMSSRRQSTPPQTGLSSITEGPEMSSPTSMKSFFEVRRCLSPDSLAGPRVPTNCVCRNSRPASLDHGQVISVAAARDGQLTFEARGETMTSALVKILEKDAHPTYKSLMLSIKIWLNGVSGEIREYIEESKRNKRDPLKKTQRTQSRARKSGDDVSQDILNLNTLMELAERANGGPLQEAVIGSERRIDLNLERFNP
ncbi:hypothetical protein M0805_007218 [Coniferiporia weirii]|nr:hypothetical protein M0805_007218 [Coniferiporia weirii]